MAYTPEFAEKTKARLSEFKSVTFKRMFGGIGIYADSLFFALIDDDVLYFKVNDSNRADYESYGMSPFIPYPGANSMGYYQVPTEILNDDNQLRLYIEAALTVAELAKSKKKPTSR
jgi:DNA transformation protein